MDLMAKGIIVPTAGEKLFPQNDSSQYACIDHVVSIGRELEHQGRKQTQGTKHLDAYLHVYAAWMRASKDKLDRSCDQEGRRGHGAVQIALCFGQADTGAVQARSSPWSRPTKPSRSHRGRPGGQRSSWKAEHCSCCF